MKIASILNQKTSKIAAGTDGKNPRHYGLRRSQKPNVGKYTIHGCYEPLKLTAKAPEK